MQEHTQVNMSRTISKDMLTMQMVTLKSFIDILPLVQLRIGGCALFVRVARAVSALSTLTGVRAAPTPAVPVGSPRPSVSKLISSSPLSRLRRKPGQIMDDERVPSFAVD